MRVGVFVAALVIVVVFCIPVKAGAATKLCPYYSGHINIEGKLGNRRDIGETSVFMPIVCSEEKILFADTRFKADNKSNREGNIGIGLRSLKSKGVLGGYAYFDRKLSGFSDKYHSQATFGAEWLAENWEMRSNAYIPLTDAIEKVSGVASLSAPFLSGSGIFTQETAQQGLRETPLYGSDIEIGFKIPDSKFWLHAGAFSFSGQDSPSLEGVRARASFQITEHIALTAEGQYDDERGRQGWLGVRLSFPLGGPAKKPDGAAARMTSSPVRDIDIVTQTESFSKGSDRLIPVLNAETGAVQRVLYVDNSAPPGGDGSLENPFNSLPDAQSALLNNDILYVSSGLGDSTNMNSGIVIDKEGVLLIGEGTRFVYDDGRLASSSGENFIGTVLREAGTAPRISNVNIGEDAITLNASNISVTGLDIENAARHGIYARAAAGTDINSLRIDNLLISGSGEDGIHIQADGAGSSIEADIISVTTHSNKNGIRFYAKSNGDVAGSLQQSIATGNEQHGVIVYDDSAIGSVDTDLGGGLRSEGFNVLYDNGLEDIAVDIDGGTLTAQNNWWGQSSGPYQSAPSGLLKPQIYYGAPIDDGLLGHWTFDSEWMAGATAYDRSGLNRNGTLQGGLSIAADQVNATRRQGLTFSGGTEAVLLPASNLFMPAANVPITVLATYRPNIIAAGSLGNRLINIRRIAGSSTLILGIGGNQVSYHEGVAAHNLAGIAVAPNTTYTSAVTYNGTTLVPYHNGVENSTQVTKTMIAGNASAAYIGSFSGSSFGFSGVIEDVRIYSRALTSDEMGEIERMNTSSIVNSGSHLSGHP